METAEDEMSPTKGGSPAKKSAAQMQAESFYLTREKVFTYASEILKIIKERKE